MDMHDLAPYFELYKNLKQSGRDTVLNPDLEKKEKEFVGKEITVTGIVQEWDEKNLELITIYVNVLPQGQAFASSGLISQHFFIFAGYKQVRNNIEVAAIQKDDLVEMQGIVSSLHRRSVLRIAMTSVKVLKQKEGHPKMKHNRGCFIATAVYGDPNAPQVTQLYLFRDQVLSRTWTGRVFIRAYYLLSPPLADWIRDRPKTKQWIRQHVLEPLLVRLTRRY